MGSSVLEEGNEKVRKYRRLAAEAVMIVEDRDEEIAQMKAQLEESRRELTATHKHLDQYRKANKQLVDEIERMKKGAGGNLAFRPPPLQPRSQNTIRTRSLRNRTQQLAASRTDKPTIKSKGVENIIPQDLKNAADKLGSSKVPVEDTIDFHGEANDLAPDSLVMAATGDEDSSSGANNSTGASPTKAGAGAEMGKPPLHPSRKRYSGGSRNARQLKARHLREGMLR